MPAVNLSVLTSRKQVRQSYVGEFANQNKEERMMGIRWLSCGRGHDFKLCEGKSVFERLDEWVRRQLRLCYWKQWTKPKTRIRALERLGIKPAQAHLLTNTRLRYWRTVQSPIARRVLDNAFLTKKGLIPLSEITNPSGNC